MKLTIKVKTPSDSDAPKTPGGKACVEVGSEVILTVEGGGGLYNWSETSKSQGPLLYTGGDVPQTDWPVIGRAFGLVNITVTDSQGDEGTLELYVGSVVIVGADGSYCQVFADGSAQPVDPKHVDPRITTLVGSNAIVADITGMASTTPSPGTPTAPAVTCYVLNLKSFALDKTKKP